MPDIIMLNDYGDGTYLGADDEGNLYDGTLTKFGWDTVDREIVSNVDGTITYKETVGGIQISGGSVREANYPGDVSHQKVMVPITNAEGNQIGEVERKISIVLWEPR